MGKLFFAATAAGFAIAGFAITGGAQAMPQPAPAPPPEAVPQYILVKVEPVTGAAHLIYHDAGQAPALEGSLVMVGQVPVFADGGCRVRDTAQEAAPSGPREPVTAPRAPPRPSDPAGARPKGRWTACS